MKDSIKRIWALTVRNLKEIVRDPLSLIFMYALPIAMLILFYLIFSKLTPQFEMQYLAPGMIPFANTFITLFLGLLIAVDRSSSFIVRLYTTKIKPYEFILSYALALIPVGLSQSAMTLLVAGVMDVSFFGVGMLAALAISVVPVILYVALGIFFGSVLSEKTIGGVASVATMGQSVLSGMWFPIEGLSEGFINFMNVLPFRNASTLMRSAFVLSYGFDDFIKPLLILLAYTVVVLTISVFAYGKKMKD